MKISVILIILTIFSTLFYFNGYKNGKIDGILQEKAKKHQKIN